MNEKLLPCPFCGSEAQRVDVDGTDEHAWNAGGSYIACPFCLASSKLVFGDKAGLEQSWNQRASATELAALREQIRVFEEVMQDFAEYTGEGTHRTPWQQIVRCIGIKARAALGKDGEE